MDFQNIITHFRRQLDLLKTTASCYYCAEQYHPPHESAEECLIREALEEIGCEVTIRRCLGTFSSIYGESGLNTIGVAYICTLSEKGKIQLSLTENSSYSWFSYDSLPDIAFLDVRNAISSWVNENNSD